MKKTKVLIVTYPLMLSKEQHETLFAKYAAFAEEQDMRLLFLTAGATAKVSDCAPADEVTFTPLNESRPMRGDYGPELHLSEASELSTASCASMIHAWDRDSRGRPRQFSKPARDAMRLIETLVNDGALALVPDRWMRGQMRFVGAPVREADKSAEQVDQAPTIQGEATSFMLDPLEQAISTTVGMLRDEHQQMAEVGAKHDTALCDRLGSHLDALLAIQIERVTA
ncbi:hypothetical protein AABC73_20585 [Pseudomonas sp. G.S.17]|uniref:hypothetical protein n=1 Tax=Pseudomonas sp. G.S.17 TaxID=3137451 RepID=UPI00311CC60A